MTTPANAAAEASIRVLMDERVQAVIRKDAEALIAHHAPGVLAYDLIGPLQYIGVAAVRQRAVDWLQGYEGEMRYEIRDLRVTAGDHSAFSYGLHHVSGTLKAGKKIEMFWRATQCWRCIGGTWLIVHEHSSVPFDMATGTVSFDLKP